MTAESEIQSLARGLKALDLIVDAGRALTITELAAALDVDKSSASRLIKTLVKYGYVQPDTLTRGYVAGRRVRSMGWMLLDRMPIREKARPYLQRLVRDTGECSHTAVYSQGMALMIDDVEAEASLRVVGGIGRMLPLHCTAVGKSLLAFADLPYPSPLEAKTPRTLTDPDALRAHLESVRTAGYAYDDEEHQPGVRCIAAPVYDRYAQVVAAIGISGPTVRVTPERVAPLAALVMQAARELSAELGAGAGRKRRRKPSARESNDHARAIETEPSHQKDLT
jgi:IclR family acetate operon transcriptional repressor